MEFMLVFFLHFLGGKKDFLYFRSDASVQHDNSIQASGSPLFKFSSMDWQDRLLFKVNPEGWIWGKIQAPYDARFLRLLHQVRVVKTLLRIRCYVTRRKKIVQQILKTEFEEDIRSLKSIVSWIPKKNWHRPKHYFEVDVNEYLQEPIGVDRTLKMHFEAENSSMFRAR